MEAVQDIEREFFKSKRDFLSELSEKPKEEKVHGANHHAIYCPRWMISGTDISKLEARRKEGEVFGTKTPA